MTAVITSTFLAMVIAMGTAVAQEEDLNEADKYMQRGDLKKAAASYDRAIRKWPKQVAPAAYGQRARIFIVQKRYRAGIEWIEQVAEKQHPGAADIEEQKALMLWALGKREDAARVAESVVSKKPYAFTNQKILGEWYHQRKQPRETAKALEQFFKNRPDEISKGDVLPRIHLGLAYLQLGNAKDAEKQFETLLKKHKNRPHAEVNANNGLCAAYTKLGKFDQAIALCERIVQNPKQIDRGGSVWYNLGQAYLYKKQSSQARAAGLEFVRLRKNEPRGFILIGDAYFQEQDWQNALLYYQQAEKKAGNRADIAGKLGVKMGTTYRRIGQVDLAIRKLEAAVANDPQNTQLAAELGAAYIANKDDDKALSTVERLVKQDSGNVDLLVIAARARYNQGKHAEALERYQQAYKLHPNDQKIKLGLVQTVNYQAYAAVKKGDSATAEKLLLTSREYDPDSPLTNRNLAVLALQQGQCDRALGYLVPLKKLRGEALMYNRLAGRANRCKKEPNLKSASANYAAAAKLARGNNLLLAEIYAEWGPLLVSSNLGDAKKKLETAVTFSARNQEIGQAAKRNLALVLFRHGWESMRSGKAADAYTDFDRAFRDPRLLKGTEPQAFEFSLAIAKLERGEAADAEKIFNGLAAKGGQQAYLKEPYDKVGAQFFAAYAKYRGGNAVQRRQAAGEFQRLLGSAKGNFGKKVRDLVASSWEYAAFDAYRAGNTGAAASALSSAEKYAAGGSKRDIDHNRAVLNMSKNPSAAATAFANMNGSPPESLVNLGIVLDMQGKPQEAYQAWARAKSKGVRARNLDDWIDAKKRIFGY